MHIQKHQTFWVHFNALGSYYLSTFILNTFFILFLLHLKKHLRRQITLLRLLLKSLYSFALDMSIVLKMVLLGSGGGAFGMQVIQARLLAEITTVGLYILMRNDCYPTSVYIFDSYSVEIYKRR